MQKLILMALLGVFLTSCSLFHVHKVEVQQGNYMDVSMVNRLHRGMTEGQVKAIMGEPILVNVMNPHIKSYVYTSQIGSETRTEERVTLLFDHGIVQDIQREGI